MKFGKLYDSCHDLPLKRFIKCMVTGNLKHLVITGYFTPNQLKTAWDKIGEQYIELAGDKAQMAILSIVKEVSQLKGKLAIIQAIVDEMSKRYDADLANMLRSMGFNYKFDISDPEKYIADLKRTVSASKPMLMRIAEKEKSLKDAQGSNTKVTEADYDKYIADLSKFQGYYIDPERSTVAQFIAVVNSYKAEIEIQKNHGRQNR